MTERLSAGAFPAFYEAVHGYEPFHWQSDLATRVLKEGRWPDLVDVPTGLGKTSMLDIAVFVAAATAHVEGPDRIGRRRLFFVVDRRLVVDEAYTHAARISRALQAAEDGVLGTVAAELRSLAPDASGDLLPVTRMRGGATWAAAWLDRPDRSGIVLGTVDQVGSRLLFRGYGVSESRRPIDAALVGTDSLIMVDEAHLATALLTTIDAAQARDTLGVPVPPAAVMRLSATAESAGHTYRLNVDAHRSSPVAWERLTAGKRLTVQESSVRNCVKDITQATVDQMAALTGRGDQAPAALVVCNTVDRAREAHTALLAALPDADCELLIGRARPLDRPGLQQRVLTLLGSGREPSDRPAVLVATQTVEVGVNLDADVLITESASWDALVQRLGRLNRLGKFRERFSGDEAAAAVVVHDGQADGPVYGKARDLTWTRLRELAADEGIEVSPLACRALSAEPFGEQEFVRTPGDVPVLLGPTLDMWVQTAPVPLNDPPIAPFLHGFDGGTAPVQVIWREGLLESDPLDDPFSDGDAERAARQIDALLTQWPPRTPEMVEVPFFAVHRWMSGQTAGPVADVDIAEDEAPRTTRPRDPFRVLAQRAARGNDSDTPMSWQWIDERALRPGDRIVAPAERGGLDGYGWAPTDTTPVPDVSEATSFAPTRSRREPALRFDAGLAARLGIVDAAEVADELMALTSRDDGEAPDEKAAAAARLLKERLPGAPPPARGWSDEAWDALHAWLGGVLRIVPIDDPLPSSWGTDPQPWTFLLTGRRPITIERDDQEVAASSVASAQVTLLQHHMAVRRRAREIAQALQLPKDLRTDLEDAAGWHDLGKVEERFQVMLHSGDPIAAALSTEPLAKSGMDPTDRMAWRLARRLSKLPPGARHEAWSAALVEAHFRALDPPYPGDRDLVVHLVASHHGHSRPFAPLVADRDPRPMVGLVDGNEVTVSSERTVDLHHPARFDQLNQRYGRWGLALLEAIVRCADTTVSGEGS